MPIVPGSPAPAEARLPDIDRELIEQFRTDLLNCHTPPYRECRMLGIAVSGGVDSLALLLLARATFPDARIEAATVDHGLRPESADEAAMVAQLCARIGIVHATLRVRLAPGNIQAQAREARYAALHRWMSERGLKALLTAHQRDDQVETMIMRLNRASGLEGLAAISRLRVLSSPGLEDLPVLRPLLSWSRSRLAGLVAEAGLTAVDDPSNSDDRFDRARLRVQLADADWIDRDAWQSSGRLLSEAAAAVAAMSATLVEDHLIPTANGGWRLAIDRLPQIPHGYWDGEYVVAIFARFGASLRRSQADALGRSLRAGKGGNVAGIAARALFERGETVWHFARENPRRTG